MQQVDVAELERALEQTGQVTAQITGTLDQFVARLTGLEQAMLPIHETTQRLARLHDNLHDATTQLEKVLAYFDLAQKLEKAIDHGPQQDIVRPSLYVLRPYQAHLNQLLEAASYLTRNRVKNAEKTLVRLQALLRKGMAKEEDVFKKVVTEACCRPYEAVALLGLRLSAGMDSERYFDSLGASYGLPDAASMEQLVDAARHLGRYETDAVVNKESPPITNCLRTYAALRSKFLLKQFQLLHNNATGIMANTLATVVNEQRAIKGSDTKLPSANEASNSYSFSSSAYSKGSHPFISYSRALCSAIYLEFLMLRRILPPTDLDHFKTTLDAILAPLLSSYQECADSLIQRAKKTAAQTQDHSCTFFLYDVIEIFMNDLQSPTWPHVEPVATIPNLFDAGDNDNTKAASGDQVPGWMFALKNFSLAYSSFFPRLLTSITLAAVRSFPDILDSLAVSSATNVPVSMPPPEDGTVHEVSSHTISWMRRLVEWSDIIEVLLLTVKDKKAEMNAETDLTDQLVKIRKTTVRSGADESEWQGSMLRRYFSDVIQALSKQLEAKSKLYIRKAFPAPLALAEQLKSSNSSTPHAAILTPIFLMNNENFILKAIRAHSRLLSIAGNDVTALLDTRVKMHLNNYLSTWIPVTEPLCITIPQTLTSKERDHVKDIFKHFNTTFEELTKAHVKWTISDPELRSQVIGEVKKVVVAKFSMFSDSVARLAVAATMEKYLRMTPADVEASIASFFDPTKS